MTSSKLALSGLVFSLLAACSVSSTEPAPASATQEMTSSWFAANLPAGSAAEAAVLALANDPSLSMGSFVSRCGFSESQAAALVSYRNGDEPASSADDQRFDSLAELDALPFTDAGFWAAAKACAAGGAPACAPPPVVIELVIDESGSMDVDGKWEASRDALLGLVDRMNASAPANVFVGALRFGTNVTGKVIPGPVASANHREHLVDLIDTPRAGGGGTATLQALEAAYTIVERASSDAGAKRVVILLSDGVPNGGTTEETRIVDLVAEKHSGAQPIVTYSVGIGAFPATSSYNPAFMGSIALRGGTAPAGCYPLATDPSLVCHHQITPGGDVAVMKDALTLSLEQIRASATASSCP